MAAALSRRTSAGRHPRVLANALCSAWQRVNQRGDIARQTLNARSAMRADDSSMARRRQVAAARRKSRSGACSIAAIDAAWRVDVDGR